MIDVFGVFENKFHASLLVNTVALNDLRIGNQFVRELPSDPDKTNSRRQVHQAIYSSVKPTPVSAPELVAYSIEVADQLGLDFEASDKDQFARVFSGNELLDGMQPYAMCYGGHQFGNWAGQLGDGRAINLGEVESEAGRFTLQLKGAGPTPYSRTADGLAVLRSSVREFLCSEAMYHLGVPTTRALSLTMTGDSVLRDMFYDGNPAMEKGAVVCRVAPSFIRFGNFELFASRGDTKTLKQLTDFTIRNHFPNLELSDSEEANKEVYIQFFREVCRTTAVMIAHWMRVGFVHGVMNTDNMSILGLTIDYGPYGWLEDYNPDWTPNTTDAGRGRYRFGHQPQVAKWNLSKLASALYPLVENVDPFYEGLELFTSTYDSSWQSMLAAKLGFSSFDRSADQELANDLFDVLLQTETDMTIFFRQLSKIPMSSDSTDQELVASISDSWYQPDQLKEDVRQNVVQWLRRYQKRIENEVVEEKCARMNLANPKFVLRNYLAQQAIDKADAGDYSMIAELLEVLRRPYDDQPEKESFAQKRPEWARHRPGCSMLSCSS